MLKLTDTQLVILSAAAARDSRSVLPLPKSLKGNKSAASRVINALLKNSLVEERPANRGAGSWREDEDGQRLALFITDAGMGALDGDAKPEASKSSKQRARGAKTRSNVVAAVKAGSSPEQTQGGKVGLIASLLQRVEGAPLSELQMATGWQPHSVRAALTGLRKKGHIVLREKQDGITRYRIAAA